MTEMQRQPGEPLLRDLTGAQSACLAVIGGVVQQHRAWPVFQYVEAQLDKQGHDALAVITSLPVMASGPFSYGLVRSERTFEPGDRIELTVAGLHHFAPVDQLATLYLRVLAGIAEASATADYDPLTVTDVQVDVHKLVTALGLAEHPFLGLLPGLLKAEPGTMRGAQPAGSAAQWTHHPGRFIRRFCGVIDVPDYLARVRAWRAPADPTPAPTASSPLGLAAALDYLSLGWKDRFGAPLVRLPNAERITRLAFDAHTDAEFDSRLSALREILKGLDVGGQPGGAGQIPAFLKDKLSPDLETALRIKDAVDTLQAVKHARDAAQHADAAPRAARELWRLGLSYPITDYSRAWRSVSAYVIDALRVLREELESNP